MTIFRFSTALIAALAIAHAAPAAAAQVIGIADGDTLTLLVNQRPLKIRLADIDAPEKKQPWGQRSKQSLSDLCWGKDARYEAQSIDRYGRTVARVYCDGVQVNRAQVESGMAWVYVRYNKDAALPDLQEQAQRRRLGLWRDPDPVEPWIYRHKSKKATRSNGSPSKDTGRDGR